MEMRCKLVKALPGVLCGVLLSATACEREPFFRDPVPFLGGVIVRCLGVTDFAERLVPCRIGTDSPAGGCACQQTPIETPLPTLFGGYPIQPITYRDANCTTTLADACVPKIIPTSASYDHPRSDIPNGQAWLEESLFQRPEDMIDGLFPVQDPNSGDVFTAREDLNRATVQACSLAHFGGLANTLFGFPYPAQATPGDSRWVQSVQLFQTLYADNTTFIDRESVRFDWDPADAIPFGEEGYGGQPLFAANGGFVQCKEGETYPFGFGAVGIFNAPAGVSNPPPDDSVPSTQSNLATCQTSDCALQPRAYSVAFQKAGSSATVRARDGNDEDRAATSGSGLLRVETTSCSHNAGGDVVCDAVVTGLDLHLEGFSLFGEEVSSVHVRGGLPSSPAVVTGSTLVIPRVEARAEIRLTDGRFDFLELSSGVVVARWEPSLGQVLAVVAFEGEVAPGVVASINGTLAGGFDNTSPVAVAKASTAAAGAPTAEVLECVAPSGTPVYLLGGQSIDPDSPPLRYRWTTIAGSVVGEAATVPLGALGLGAHGFRLTVLDHRGELSRDDLAVSIVDTTPPILELDGPECLWPPNHKTVRLRLGDELIASSSDSCGTVGVRVVDVESNQPMNGPGDGNTSPDFAFTDSEVCLRVERTGGADRVYTIVVEAEDSNGNVTTRELAITIPKSPSNSQVCHSWKDYNGCAL